MASPSSGRRFFLVLLVGATILFALVVRPLASALFLAAVMAGVLWPVQAWLTRRLRGRAGLSAGFLVAGVTLILLVPVVAFSTFAIKEGSAGVAYLRETISSDGVSGLIDRLPEPLDGLAHKALKRLNEDSGGDLAAKVQKQVSSQGGRAAAMVGATVAATGAFLFQAVMMLIAFYFLLLQGKELVAWIDDISPLRRGQTRELLYEFKRVSYAVILSTVITSAVQAVAALAGYLIARVPHPIFFTGVTFFAAFIPAIGAGAVCLVAALLLFASGHPYMALFLTVWGLTIVGLVDNLVKPFLIKGGMQMNGAVVFFALIGGLSAFGAVGLLLGPLVVALLLSLLRMYQRDFNTAHAKSES